MDYMYFVWRSLSRNDLCVLYRLFLGACNTCNHTKIHVNIYIFVKNNNHGDYMPKIPPGKKLLQAYIDENLYKQIIEIAPIIYGKYKGAISYVVEDALRQYLKPKAPAHTTYTQNPSRSVRQVYKQVIERIKFIENIDFEPEETTEKILDMAIAEVRGSDPRTIRKWKEIFEKSGLIKFVGGFYPNRIVELL